jgi:hypothetical protein
MVEEIRLIGHHVVEELLAFYILVWSIFSHLVDLQGIMVESALLIVSLSLLHAARSSTQTYCLPRCSVILVECQ